MGKPGFLGRAAEKLPPSGPLKRNGPVRS